MPVGRTRNIQPVGRIELLGVAVGRTDAKIELAALGQLNAAYSCIDGGSPVSKLIRTFESKKLFDGGPDQFRISQQCAALIRPFDQQLQPVADEVGGGFVPGIQYEDAVLQQLRFGQLLAVAILTE